MNNPTVKRIEVPETNPLKAYKAFKRDGRKLYTDGNGSNRNKTYWKNGQVQSITGDIELCSNGLHWFRHLCFAVDYLEPNCAICEVEVWGDTIEDTEKGASRFCKITKRLNLKEVHQNFIDCANNSGHRNSGHRNSGYGNSGYGNSGDGNSGDGYRNYFCTETRYFLLDIEVKEIPRAIKYLNWDWFSLFNDDGSVRTYYEAWDHCPDSVLSTIGNVPEFQTEEARKKFKEITGLELP